MPSFNRFTIKAQEALQNAQELVARQNHGELKALHLLSALLSDEQTLVRPMFLRANTNLIELEKEIENQLQRLPKIFAGGTVSQLYLSQELMKILDRAAEIAMKQKHEFAPTLQDIRKREKQNMMEKGKAPAEMPATGVQP